MNNVDQSFVDQPRTTSVVCPNAPSRPRRPITLDDIANIIGGDVDGFRASFRRTADAIQNVVLDPPQNDQNLNEAFGAMNMNDPMEI